jgi:hypothetical protein
VSLFNARDKQLVERNPYLKLEKPAEAGENIIDPGTLERIAHRVLDAKKTDPVPGYRTRLNDCRWRVQNLLNVVDEPLWEKHVELAIQSMLKTINNSQPNGTWVPCEYDTRIAHIGKDKEAFIELVVRFVDTDNNQDMLYQDGRPVMNVNVQQTALDPAVLESLSRRADGDPEMKAILAALVQQQAMMAEFMLRQSGAPPLAASAAPAPVAPTAPASTVVMQPYSDEPTLEELVAQASAAEDLPATPVRKGGRKTKAVEPTADIDPAALDALASLPVEE